MLKGHQTSHTILITRYLVLKTHGGEYTGELLRGDAYCRLQAVKRHIEPGPLSGRQQQRCSQECRPQDVCSCLEAGRQLSHEALLVQVKCSLH